MQLLHLGLRNTLQYRKIKAQLQNGREQQTWQKNSQEIERMGKYNLFKTVLRVAMCKGAKIKMVRYLKNGGIEFTFAFADQRNMEYFTDVLKFQMVL